MYDLEWARQILADFEQKHGDRSQAVSKAWGLSRNDVATMVATNQEAWRFYKRYVKIEEKFGRLGARLDRAHAQFQKYYYTNVK